MENSDSQPAESAASAESETAFFSVAPIAQIEKELAAADTPITIRMQRLFELREHHSPAATSLLLGALKDRRVVDSVLFRHEAAYVLGQLGDPEALAFLQKALQDETEHEMVRHEKLTFSLFGKAMETAFLLQAAEALAAVGEKSSLPTLCRYLLDPSKPVRETCLLAVLSLYYKNEMEDSEERAGVQLRSAFNTIDPSEAFPDCTLSDIPRLSKMLLDENADLWNRYRALMTLRDLRHPTALAAIAASLREDSSSALFRHEVAFVLGQARLLEGSADPCRCTDSAEADLALQQVISEQTATLGRSLFVGLKTCCAASVAESANRKAFWSLADCLQDEGEHIMARHEAALALGSLAADARAEYFKLPNGNALRLSAVDLLTQYCESSEQCVAESCQVALHQMEEEIQAVVA